MENQQGKNIKISEVPSLLRFWDEEKNTDLDINELTAKSSKTAYWHCKKCNYKWPQRIQSRYESNGKCPCCDTHSVIMQGISDIFTLVPGLDKYYDFEKNKDVDVLTLRVGTKDPLWWKCSDCGREWKSTIPHRIKKENGAYRVVECQNCYHKSRLTTVADTPAMLILWDYESNLGIEPAKTSVFSTASIHWKCKKCNYTWEDSPKVRHDQNYRCPGCDNKRKAIRPGKNDVLSCCPDIADYINNDRNKGIDFTKYGIYSKVEIAFKCPDCGDEWTAPLKSRIAKKADGTFRVKKHSCNHDRRRKESFTEEFPYLELLYDHSRNKKKLSDIRSTKDAMMEYHFLCDKCGESYPSTIIRVIGSMKNNTNGCPYCAHAKLRPNESFANLHPELLEEYDSSNLIDPYNTFPNSKENVLWKCTYCGHKWPSSFAKRHGGTGKCPICYPTIAIPDINTVAAIHPAIANMWSAKNAKGSNETLYNSTQWVNLICPTCEQDFGTFLNEFINGEYSCPFCKGKKPIPDKNSILALHPEILNIWSPNNSRKPENIFPDSTDQAKFICETCNGEYTAVIKDVVTNATDCPYCNERKPLSGRNTFMAKHQNLMDEWDWVSNYCLVNPDNILDNNTTPVWWNCKNNSSHRYKMSVNERLKYEKRNREPCIYCKGRRRKKKHFL